MEESIFLEVKIETVNWILCVGLSYLLTIFA